MNKWRKRCCELNYGGNKENTTICFVATDKHPYLVEQVEELKVYFKDVFIMIDKNYDDLELPYIQAEDNPDYYKTMPTFHADGYGSWSKSLDYFSDLQTDNIWFIEYDVFVPDINILLKLNQHKEHLLVKDHIAYTGKRGEWSHWKRFKSENINDFDKKWFHSLTCICRLSKDMLQLISEFATSHNTLFFHEILFNTLAENNNLSIKCCEEFKYVVFKGNSKQTSFTCADVNKCGRNYIYHPVKDLDAQRNIKYGKKIIHQIFLNITGKTLEEFPIYVKCMEKTKKWCVDNGWEHKLWTDIPWELCDEDDIHVLKEGSKRYSFIPCDYIRYIILEKIGGMYMDLDNAPTDKLNEIIDRDIIIGAYCNKHPSNTIIDDNTPELWKANNNVIKLPHELVLELRQYSIQQFKEKEKIKVYETWKRRFFFQSVSQDMFIRFMKLKGIPFDKQFYDYFDENLTCAWGDIH